MPLPPLFASFRRYHAGIGPAHLPRWQCRAGPRPLSSAQLTEHTGAGPEVARVEDLSIPGRGGAIPARFFSSDNSEAVVLYLHGGGWALGSIDEWDALARTFAHALPASVLLLGYRLAPEHPYPAALNDAWDALQWAAEHIERLAGRQVPIIVIGDSAGGNLAAVLAQKVRDAGGPSVSAQALIYPIADITMSTQSCAEFEDYSLFNTDDLRWLTQQYVGDNPALHRDPAVSPLFGQLEGLAPAVVMTCQYDPLRDEGNNFAHALSAAAIRSSLTRSKAWHTDLS